MVKTQHFVLMIVTAVNFSSASMSQIRQTLQNLHFAKSDVTGKLRAVAASRTSLDSPVRLKTSFSSFFYEQLKKIDNYGCWCSFSDDTGFGGEPGYGKVMDEIDQICKNLRQGYRCAMIDDQKGGCLPWAANYSSSNSLLTDEEQILDACRLDNSDVKGDKDCAVRACALENTFILDFIKYLVSGKEVNPQFMASEGEFNKKANCKIDNKPEQDELLWARSAAFLLEDEYSGSGNGNGGIDGEHIAYVEQIIPEKMCCGTYPKRFPFVTRGGQRACCKSRTYDTTKFECCDGRVAASCL